MRIGDVALRWPVTDVNQRVRDRADSAFMNELIGFAIPETKTAVVIDAQVNAAIAGGGHHLPSFVHGCAQGFLAKYMTTGRDGVETEVGVQVVRRRDRDDI